MSRLRASLERDYFSRWPNGYLDTELGRADLHDHLAGRLHHAQTRIVPWLESTGPLGGARVLVIGCGTGSELVALAQVGALVTAVDVDEDSLRVAQTRCALHGVTATLIAANAVDVKSVLGHATFDVILFYASLEHMTQDERMRAISDTWSMLRPGDRWGLVETPNRLWHTDTHTAHLPFFYWLPDEVAFQYARFSPRENFRDLYDDATNPERFLHFLRRGRGVSYHELHLALPSPDAFEVVSCLHDFWDGMRRWRRPTASSRYSRLLEAVAPDVPTAFLREYLDIVLRRLR